MRRSTMLKFDTYYPMDKDLGYSSQDEAHFNDLFEQFLNDDPTPLTGVADGSEDLHALEYTFEEETEPSESSSADSKFATLNSPPTGLNYLPIERSLAFRPQQTLAQPQPKRAISSSELLRLEGKAPPVVGYNKAPSTYSSSSAAPTLRRKGKFCAPAPGPHKDRSERISKKSSREMSRSAFSNQRNDNPAYPDWAQRFEQISIQQPMPHLQTSSPRPSATYKDKRPGNIMTVNHTPSHTPSHDRLPVATPSRQEQRPSVGSEISQGSRLVTVAISPTLQAWENHEDVSPMTLSNDNDHLRAPHLRHADTWSHSPVSPLGEGPISPLSPGYVVSPQHVQPSWLHGIPSNMDSYYHNSGASPQSSATAQLSAHAIPDFTPHDLMNHEPYSSFINEDPSSAYSVIPADNPFQSPVDDFSSPNFYKHQNGDILNGITQSQSQTSPPLSGPSPPLQSPSKHRSDRSLRSKAHRRGLKSLGNLRTPKSASALKQPKSASTLRSPRSTTGNFGFVNFTPDDKSKILTGVAPSGSSKTKQRREQEAMDRKRKSSHVALKVMEAVGGDVERFKRELEREGMELAI